MAEWFNASDLKSDKLLYFVGSNPIFSLLLYNTILLNYYVINF